MMCAPNYDIVDFKRARHEINQQNAGVMLLRMLLCSPASNGCGHQHLLPVLIHYFILKSNLQFVRNPQRWVSKSKHNNYLQSKFALLIHYYILKLFK